MFHRNVRMGVSNDVLTGIVVLLVGGYWVQLIYRLHKAEEKIDKMQTDLAKSLLDAANALVAAAVAAKGSK